MSTPIEDVIDDESSTKSFSLYSIVLVAIGLYVLKLWMTSLDGVLSTYIVEPKHYALVLVIATIAIVLLLKDDGLVKIDR